MLDNTLMFMLRWFRNLMKGITVHKKLKNKSKATLKILANLILIIGFAYGVRVLFSTMPEMIAAVGTVVATVFIAAWAHLE